MTKTKDSSMQYFPRKEILEEDETDILRQILISPNKLSTTYTHNG